MKGFEAMFCYLGALGCIAFGVVFAFNGREPLAIEAFVLGALFAIATALIYSGRNN